MTNNPTIDGVSRITDAPAGERQDSITFPRDMTDEMAEAIALRANCCGGIAYDVWEDLVRCVEKPKHPDIEVCGSWPIQSEPRPRISDLQSTIAQLEDKLNKAIDLDFQRRETIARLEGKVQELESGRGDPVAYLCNAEGARWLQYHPKLHKPWDPEDVSITPLYAAPPAPVAVVLPERIPFTSQGTFDQGWNACLDATAALNKHKPAEWHDVAGNDEGLAQ